MKRGFCLRVCDCVYVCICAVLHKLNSVKTGTWILFASLNDWMIRTDAVSSYN